MGVAHISLREERQAAAVLPQEDEVVFFGPCCSNQVLPGIDRECTYTLRYCLVWERCCRRLQQDRKLLQSEAATKGRKDRVLHHRCSDAINRRLRLDNRLLRQKTTYF